VHRHAKLAVLTALVTVAVLVAARPVRADALYAGARCAVVSRSNVAACAVGASATVLAEREGIAAASGRRSAASPWFPSNPTLGVSAARRAGGAEGQAPAFNYAASLAQEIEVSGQRASRRRAADAEVAARTNDTLATTRDVAARAYVAYFQVLASRDALAVARRLEGTGLQVARVTRARADAGVSSAVDAEVADAASLRLVRDRLEAERAERVAHATLAMMLGREPIHDGVVATGELAPLAGTDAVALSATARGAAQALRERPQVKALHDEKRAFEARAQGFRRARLPSFTLQLFAQNDGFNERVFGAGIAVPIPLPEPVGHTFAGEAAESEAVARQSAARAEHVTRVLSTELAVALAGYESASAQLALYTTERVSRTERVIADMAAEVEAGRLAVRDAVVAQQQLMDVLRGQIEARRAVALASVDLALAAGVPLEGAAR
jgi:outer membrane protein, heavy metal efflux system